MTQGTIRRLIDKPKDGGGRSKFGYITTPEHGDVFFLPSSLDKTKSLDWDALREGQIVLLDVAQASKGPRAENVRAQA